MRLVNLTPHPITLIRGDQSLTIPPSPQPARCSTRAIEVGSVTCDGLEVPVFSITFGEVTGLPEPEEDTMFIVSSIVAQAVRHRRDVVMVHDTVRDEQGNIVGARALAYP